VNSPASKRAKKVHEEDKSKEDKSKEDKSKEDKSKLCRLADLRKASAHAAGRVALASASAPPSASKKDCQPQRRQVRPSSGHPTLPGHLWTGLRAVHIDAVESCSSQGGFHPVL
jgi:hypothetical protein